MEKERMEFKNLCRGYHAQKKWLREKGNQAGCEGTEAMIAENVKTVETTLQKIEERFGRSARRIVSGMYVDHISQKEMAELCGIPLRTLQRRLHTWTDFSGE